MIITTEQHVGLRRWARRGRLAEAAPVAYLSAHPECVGLPPGDAVGGPPVFAEVNHSRWLGRCGACGHAQVVTPSDPRFYCPECGQSPSPGLWRPVLFPDAKAAIEAALDARPDPRTRNWTPGEQVGDLLAENTEHGVR